MATERELVQSILKTIAASLSASDELLSTDGVHNILMEMDDLAGELKEVLE